MQNSVRPFVRLSVRGHSSIYLLKGDKGCCKGQEQPRRVEKGQEVTRRFKQVQESFKSFKKFQKVIKMY